MEEFYLKEPLGCSTCSFICDLMSAFLSNAKWEKFQVLAAHKQLGFLYRPRLESNFNVVLYLLCSQFKVVGSQEKELHIFW